jgi:hypothetical protein
MVQLAALASHRPLTLLIGSDSAMVDTVDILVVCLLVALTAYLIYLALLYFKVSGWKALTGVSAGTILFWHASGFGVGLPIPSWLSQIVFAVLVLTAAIRFAEHRYMKVGLVAASLTLSGSLAIYGGVSAMTAPEPVVGAQEEAPEFEFQVHPDIYLVILDGYPSSDVIDRFFGHDNSPFESALQDHGLEVYPRATANYPVTHFSIPSLLNMSYMHGDPGPISRTDLDALAAGIAGDNAVIDTLKANGYIYVHGETITHYNRCGDRVDICLPGPHLDVPTFALLQGTPIGSLLYRKTGDPATRLNLERIDQMRNWSSIMEELPSGPVITFLHLILPHPPLYLDRQCNVRLDPDLGGSVMIQDDLPAEAVTKRHQAWVEQLECANRATLDFLTQVNDDAVVIVTSDHGSDSSYRLFGEVTDYTDDDLIERFSILAAARLPAACRNVTPADVSLVNLFRYVFACLADETPDPLPDRKFLASFGGLIVEVKHPNQSAD